MRAIHSSLAKQQKLHFGEGRGVHVCFHIYIYWLFTFGRNVCASPLIAVDIATLLAGNIQPIILVFLSIWRTCDSQNDLIISRGSNAQLPLCTSCSLYNTHKPICPNMYICWARARQGHTSTLVSYPRPTCLKAMEADTMERSQSHHVQY